MDELTCSQTKFRTTSEIDSGTRASVATRDRCYMYISIRSTPSLPTQASNASCEALRCTHGSLPRLGYTRVTWGANFGCYKFPPLCSEVFSVRDYEKEEQIHRFVQSRCNRALCSIMRRSDNRLQLKIGCLYIDTTCTTRSMYTFISVCRESDD